MLVHLDPALDNRPKKNEKNNRLVFGNCYLSVSRYQGLVFRWWQASSWPSWHWYRERLPDRNAPFFSFSIWSSYKHLFIQPTKFYPGRQRTLARIRGPKAKHGRILQVRRWLFDNYLFEYRLEKNQSIKQIQRLEVNPALLQNTQRHWRSEKSHHTATS